MDLIDWLKSSSLYPKLYWQARGVKTATAALGVGDHYPFYIAPFSPYQEAIWQEFPQKTVLSFQEVRFAETTAIPWKNPYEIEKVSLSPSYPEWKIAVEKAKLAFQKKRFQKVVLTRKVSITLKRSIDPWAMFRSYIGEKGAYTFCFSPCKQSLFFGSSPERLLKQEGNNLYTEALAGTRPYDARYELMENKKELQEFAIVEKKVLQEIKRFCFPVVASKKQIKISRNIAHLHRYFQGTLLPGKSIDLLIDSLHPTPAILGDSSTYCQEFLAKYAAFDRGLYCGLIGPKTPSYTDLCVAIRSLLIEQNTIHLFSGAGIVRESDPEKEWNELNEKLEPYLKKLCLTL